MADLTTRMNASICASGCVNHQFFATEPKESLFQRLLDAGGVGLPLPAGIEATVIFNGEFIAWHGTALSDALLLYRSAAFAKGSGR